jgi:UDP-N-acetylmuramoyl-tripeptide--D-alanyl-D-alanine ligase
VVALVVMVVLRADVAAVVVSVLYGVFCPQGLSMKGRTGALHWTRRLVTIFVVATVMASLLSLAGAFTPRPWLLAIAMVWAVPGLLAISARLLSPYEEHRAGKFVVQAADRLRRVQPRVVGITGSYGKTSTKNHLADLLGTSEGVVASPRSFNNRAGLSRAINENLAEGSRVFIAEMGTYGLGEIASLCSWCPPEIAVITAIGPVHLERMKSLSVIERAKYEITERAQTVVVNIDDPTLVRWPGRLESEGKRVRTVGSKNVEATVRVESVENEWRIWIDGAVVCSMDLRLGVQPTNLACAIGAALELGVLASQIGIRLTRIQSIVNRSQVVTAASGVLVIDDTFNANPASAFAALTLLTSLPLSGRRVVVTPGLIELGSDQYGENLSLAQKVAAYGGELVVVGRTNAKSLQVGYQKPVRRFNTRDEAVTWVRSSLVTGDGVLYLNDLPDHYP